MNKIKSLNLSEKIHFSKRLGFLLSAGISLVESLEMLKKNAKSKKEIAVLDLVIQEVAAGGTLSAAFKEAKIFNHFGIYMIRVGEESGNLDKSLGYISEEMTKKQALQQKILGALIYPVIIGLASIILSVLLVTFVFPKILPILSAVNGTLPLITRLLLSTHDFLKHFGLIALSFFSFLVFVLYFLFIKKPQFRFRMEKIIIHLPRISILIVYYQLILFARTLGLLLKNHMVLNKSIDLIANYTSNTIYKKMFTNMHQELLRGSRLSGWMKTQRRLFPVVFEEMVEVGESTGKLSETLLDLSKFYENELEDRLKILSSLIEPLLMIFIGVVVGVVALSIMLPIYQITSNLHHQ